MYGGEVNRLFWTGTDKPGLFYVTADALGVLLFNPKQRAWSLNSQQSISVARAGSFILIPLCKLYMSLELWSRFRSVLPWHWTELTRLTSVEYLLPSANEYKINIRSVSNYPALETSFE